MCVRVENGARIADAKLNPITGRALNNYKYTRQFITVERVPCSLPCARRLKILFFTYLFSYIYIYYLYIYIIYACEWYTLLSVYFSISVSHSLSLFRLAFVLFVLLLFVFFFLNEPRTAPDVGYRYPWSHEASFCRIASVW